MTFMSFELVKPWSGAVLEQLVRSSKFYLLRNKHDFLSLPRGLFGIRQRSEAETHLADFCA